MQDDVSKAVALVLAGHPSFFKFIAANETGDTGGHQCGFYIPKEFQPRAFHGPCVRGENRDLQVRIIWNDTLATDSRLVYYGQGTRNESRITNFGRGFPFLLPEYTGALVVFIQDDLHDYHSFVFNTDDEIEDFLGALGLGPTDANRVICLDGTPSAARENAAFAQFIETLAVDFPSSEEMSAAARRIENEVYDHEEYVRTQPDKKLIRWSDVEYRLFRALEGTRYKKLIENGFASVEEFVQRANEILNRRKSRAGKSLEHHLAAIFSGNRLTFEEQVVTEGNKKPDFIFPFSLAYHDQSFADDKLIFLAAKTTCKDRWRQVLVEADRFRSREKFLCTLQQGMSERQMDEMASEKILLVVPGPYISDYPRSRQDRLWTIERFVEYAKGTQA